MHWPTTGPKVSGEPEQELAERGIAFEKTEFRAIKLISEVEFKQIFTKLVGVNVALAPNDRDLVEWFVKWYGPALPLPKRVPYKETRCLLASFGVDVPVKTRPTCCISRQTSRDSGGS